MWRAVLLGKIVVAIVVCIVGSIVCIRIAGDPKLATGEAIRWYGLSIFFVAVGTSFGFVVYLLFRRRIGTKDKLLSK